MDLPTFKIRWPKHYTVRFKNSQELETVKAELGLSKKCLWREVFMDDGTIYVEVSLKTMSKVSQFLDKIK